jgi:acyloxyacyl hydrolase
MREVAEMQQHCTNADFKELPSADNGGFDNECAICVVVLRVMENYAVYHKLAIPDFVNKQFCQLFDDSIKPTCEAFVHFAGPVIVQTLVEKAPSDKACLALGLCQNKQCHILNAKKEEYGLPPAAAPTVPSPWKWLIHIFVDKFGNGHFPVFDMDNDTYSDVSTFRGYHWRGDDCNELNANVYPGRKTGSKLLDHDCNGIFGLDNRGRLYEDKFCAPYKRYGVAVIGDSAGAHFSIPEKYFNVSMMKKGTFDDLLPRLADELDLPQESAYTGHTLTSYASRSVYKYLREWNLCNHNDFQNIAVNGADSDNSRNNIPALKRNPKEDYPLIMFLELIGNDVCSKSLEGERKPEDFRRYITRLLETVDMMVPAGSHMVIFGLGDGGLLYDNLHDDIHPLNVTYRTVYDFLNCLKISPCWGWLNSNDTVREFTTERAKNLSKIYAEIIAEKTFKNFDVAYYDFPAMEVLTRRVLEGKDPKEMIERCDGFHPNGEFHSYLADWLWVKLRNEHPDWIGQQNPHNAEIRSIFGMDILH